MCDSAGISLYFGMHNTAKFVKSLSVSRLLHWLPRGSCRLFFACVDIEISNQHGFYCLFLFTNFTAAFLVELSSALPRQFFIEFVRKHKRDFHGIQLTQQRAVILRTRKIGQTQLFIDRLQHKSLLPGFSWLRFVFIYVVHFKKFLEDTIRSLSWCTLSLPSRSRRSSRPSHRVCKSAFSGPVLLISCVFSWTSTFCGKHTISKNWI